MNEEFKVVIDIILNPKTKFIAKPDGKVIVIYS